VTVSQLQTKNLLPPRPRSG